VRIVTPVSLLCLTYGRLFAHLGPAVPTTHTVTPTATSPLLDLGTLSEHYFPEAHVEATYADLGSPAHLFHLKYGGMV
jgi:hypothetical protein